jgi:hypothetical protein
MSQIETAVLASKKIEAILRDGFAAEGRGLHEYLDSVEHRIPDHIVKKARYIASVRNQVVHKDGVIADLADFNQTVADVVAALNDQLAQEQMARENEERLRREQEAHQYSLHHPSVSGNDFKSEHNDLIMSLKYLKTQNTYLVVILFALLCLCVYLFIRPTSDNNNSAEVNRLNSQILKINRELRYVEREVAALERALKQTAKAPTLKELTAVPEQKVVSASTEPKTPKPANEDANKTAIASKAPDVSQQRKVIEPSPTTQNEAAAKEENPLLAKARAASDEYDKAYQDIHVNFVGFVQKQTKITLGQPDVSQNANGTYNVRVPVSWTIPETELLSRLNRYFNSYDGTPLLMSSEHMRNDKNRLVISKRYAESSTAIKPYTGRLYSELQKLELSIEVSLGNKKGTIIIAANASCHVSCSYSENASDSWIIQSKGKPGLNNLHWQQESPVVIEGLTEQDLASAAKPSAVVKMALKRGRS